MHDILALPLRDLLQKLAQREVTVTALTRAVVERIELAEPRIRAWAWFDAAHALEQAHRLDAQAASGRLYGLPVGVKDLIDTADMPTSYGSPIYAGHRPRMDAAAVAAIRGEGAVVLGKTITTEFATFQPGPTVNPRAQRVPHTPGGSSSGSAAAVAAGMVPVAFGTQTAGSIIRPAAYCGVVGYKPTFGLLPTAGIKPLAPSLDTLGVLARSVEDAACFVGTLARLPLADQAGSDAAPIRIGLCHTPHAARASAAAIEALHGAAAALARAGATVVDIELPAACGGLDAAQTCVMEYEAAAAFAPEAATVAHLFSPGIAAMIRRGREIDGETYFAAMARRENALHAMASVYRTVDVLLCPSAEGEAPKTLASTGDPVFNRMWSLLGNPCVHVPVTDGPAGLPLGVTLAGPHRMDGTTLFAARMLESALQQ